MSSPPQTAEIPYNAVPTNPVLPRTYSSTSSGRKSYGPFGGGVSSDRESGKFQAYDEDDDEVSGGHELDNFYDRDSIPAPHRLSTYSSTSRPGSFASTGYSDPFNPSRPLSSASLNGLAASNALPRATSNLRPLSGHLPIPSEQFYPEPTGPPMPIRDSRKSTKRKRLFWIIGVALGIAALIGIIVGVVVTQVRKNQENGRLAAEAAKNGTITPGQDADVGSDPSVFDKNPDLHQSLWGLAYTPNLAQPPWCGATQANVTRDIQLLSQLTTRIRLYGANCNQSALVLQAIQDTKVDMTVWLGIYIDSNTTAYENQLDEVVKVLETYGTDHVAGITVGNEYILNQLLAAGGNTDPTLPLAVSSSQFITTKVREVRTRIDAMGLSKGLDIGTSDAGSILTTALAQGVDYFMSNVHPWFAQVSVNTAAGWTADFYQEFNVDVAATASNKPKTYIAETGWPTDSMNASLSNSGFGGPTAEATDGNLQIFLDTFVCQANKNGTEYFFFEAFDEPWKRQFDGVEPYWGLFDHDRNFKDIKIPTC